MRFIARLQADARRLIGDCSAVVAVTTAICSIALVSVLAVSIEASRAYTLKRTLADAVDSATLALARRMSNGSASNSDNSIGFVNGYIKANLEGVGYTGVSFEDNTQVNIDEEIQLIAVDTEAELDTVFSRLLKINALTIGSHAEARYGNDKETEVAMVLDGSPSLVWAVTTLKNSAKKMINDLLAGQSGPTAKTRVSLLYYSWGVYVGPRSQRLLRFANSGANCMAARRLNQFNDAAPASSLMADSFRKLHPAYCPSGALVPLTSNVNTLLTAADRLEPFGGTATEIGINWGWYTLSPHWANFWGQNHAPIPYGKKDSRKIMVLMSDGRAQTYYDFVLSMAGASDMVLVSGHNRVAEAERRARQACDGVKASGVEIYAIFFTKYRYHAEGKDLMEYCASGRNNFFMAVGKDGLEESFMLVTRKIKKLYLSR